MDRRMWSKLVVLAALTAVVFFLAPGEQGTLLMLGALPFSWLGNWLRALSLSGDGGNAAAIFLYGAICLLPLLPLLRKKRDRAAWVLALDCPVLFYVLYMMINPGLMPMGMDGDVGRMILSGTVYSVLLSWGALKLLRKGDTPDKNGCYHALRVLLGICAGLYIAAGFGVGAGELKAKLLTLRAENTMPGQSLWETELFLILIFAVQAFEYLLDACLMLRGIGLTKLLEADPYSESCAAAARELSEKARLFLIAVLLSNMALNIAQVLAASRLYHIDAAVRIPVFSVALCFGCMVLTRLLSQGKELKEENDLYI